MQAGAEGVSRICLLGPLEVLADGRALDLGGARPRLLLAMLAVARGEPVRVEALAEEIWGPSPRVDVGGALQRLVSRLRQALTPVAGLSVTAVGAGYVLRGADVDIGRFDDLVGRARVLAADGSHAEAAAVFREALALWRGSALDGYVDRPFAQAEAARLAEARCLAAEALADALLGAGRAAEAVELLHRLVVEAPYREDAWARLMLGLYRTGRQADALEAFRRCRRLLTEDLGLEPGPALRRLEAQVLAQSSDLDGPEPAGAQAPRATGGVSAMRAFLFTDIESSTRRWEGDADAMAADLSRHDDLLRAAVSEHAGRLMSHTGDGICADFPTAADAIGAAVAAQRALGAATWRGAAALRVRMAVHAGATQARDGNFFGPTLNRTARLMSLGAGGQVLCSHPAADLARDALPADVGLLDLGEHELADLGRPEHVFQVTHPDLQADFPRARAARAHPHNLPTATARFLGRTAELAELEELLRAERLITLWGPGGVGKTRLSLEAARRAVPDFPDGVWLVELVPIDRGDLVAPAVMSAIGMVGAAPETGSTGEICRYLSNRQALIVLDNCEHVLGAAARVAHELLSHCPGVRVLTSSREPLGVPGEYVWPARSLAVPAEGADLAAAAACDAVALFCDRAARAHPAFALTPANASAVAEICRRLDGVPLALELGAARVRVLGVQVLAERLDDRFRVLVGGPRTADPRHQTLAAAVGWSYDLLPPAEARMLESLSVFPGTFDLAAAEAVAATEESPDVGFEALDLLSRLVDKSLVETVEDERGVRYRMLETIRQYAGARLAAAGGTAAARRRHLDHFLAAPVCDWRVRIFDEVVSYRYPSGEEHNFRAAVEWALAERDADAAVRLTSSLYTYWAWMETPTVTPRTWLEEALALPGGSRSADRALALAALSWYARDNDIAEAALALARETADPVLVALVLMAVSSSVSFVDPAGVPRVTPESLESLLLAAGGVEVSGLVRSWFHFGLAWQALAEGDHATGADHAERALATAVPRMVVGRPNFLGTLAYATALLGDAERAEAVADEALAAARQSRIAVLPVMALARAAAVACFGGRWAHAEACLDELLPLLRRLNTQRWAGDALELAGVVLEATGRPGAPDVLRAAVRHRAAVGERCGGGSPQLAALVAGSRERLDIKEGDAPSGRQDLDGDLAAAFAAFAGARAQPPDVARPNRPDHSRR